MLARNEITAVVPGIFKTPPRRNEDLKKHHIKAIVIYSSVLNSWLNNLKISDTWCSQREF